MVVENLLVQTLQLVRQVIGIAVLRIEMNTSVAVLFQYRAKIFLHNRQLFRLVRQVVHLQERRSLAVRIKHITALVLTVQIRRTHSVQQISRFFGGEQTGGQNRHLTLQHRIEVLYLYIGFGETDQIVCFVQSVGSFVRANGIVYLSQGSAEELLHLVSLHRHMLTAQSSINAGAVAFTRVADNIGELPPVAVHIGMADSAKETHSLFAELYIFLHQPLQESHVTPHVAKRHHGRAVTHQRVIGIVPFRTKRVHPYTGFGNEIRQFGQQRDQQLVRHRGMPHMSVPVQQQLTVCTHRSH